MVGAGAGLSTSAGLTYDGARFRQYFGDFEARYGIRDMYSGGFYPFGTLEEYWAWWSRQIWVNRYQDPPGGVYGDLLRLVEGKEYFVLTTNVDHCFQRAGFEKERLFYTQGDYGLFQCSQPCCQETWDNEEVVRRMVAEQRDLRISTELVPHCPHCGKPLTMNLRVDNHFVQDQGWYAAAERYGDFLRRHGGGRVAFLELGVGWNTPGIIKYPFWKYVRTHPESRYLCVNREDAYAPPEWEERAVCLNEDIGAALRRLLDPTGEE